MIQSPSFQFCMVRVLVIEVDVHARTTTQTYIKETLHNPNTGLLRFACNDGIG